MADIINHSHIIPTTKGANMNNKIFIRVMMSFFAVLLSTRAPAKDIPQPQNDAMIEIVVRHMVEKLPKEVRKICVTEAKIIDKSTGLLSFELKPIGRHIDKRIDQDPKFCNDQFGKKYSANIVYSMLQDKEMDEIFFRDEAYIKSHLHIYMMMKMYVSKGYTVFLAADDRCGTDLWGFVFKYTPTKIHLINMIKIGQLECLRK